MIAATIRRMHEAGASVEAIIVAVEAIEAELAGHRKAAAERAKRYRDSKRHATSRDDTHAPLSGLTSPGFPSPITPSLPPPPSSQTPEESLSEASSDAPKKRVRKTYQADFEAFWKEYPTDANMSKFEAAQAWARMSDEDRIAATESLSAFRAHCAADPTYRPIHASRYLLKRRYDGHLEKAKEIAAACAIKATDPSWPAWRAHYVDLGKRFFWRLMDSYAEQGKPFTVPSLWPPGHKHLQAAE